MKKQRKQLIILLVILAALAAGFLGLKQYNKLQSEKPVEEEEEITVVNLNREDVIRFSYDYEGTTYAFEKKDDTWYYAEDASLNLIQSSVSAKAAKACPMTAEQVIENVTDMAQYGLEEPAKTLTFETETESVILYVGDYNSVSKVYYLCKPSEATVYTVAASDVTAFDYSLEDLVEEEESAE